ncbi:MAG: bifunctional glutamate N-acetyltransferase/amino-acid acetyltransferase ArgJ [Deltaproteobacteria bacterium]|nr:bifunctional glutamate N-acetyltransferase/amino-acid acetyltransferase ArgJ [Candidatus Anaeroferrophillacea bacterium]
MMCRGYRFAGVHCGLKAAPKLDLGVIMSDRSAAAAALFTTNRFPAAPVIAGRRQLAAGGPVRLVVVNSGNANACTGEEGIAAVRRIAAAAGAVFDVPAAAVFVGSTGVIGEPLPVARLESGLPAAREALAEDGLDAFSRAIMTTDSHPKVAAGMVEIAGHRVGVLGIAKGAGMIEPHMATMLAYLLTDADVASPRLDPLLRRVAANSFNRITVDGDTSTNDTVLLLANGASGCRPETAAELALLEAELERVAGELARMIVADGEGATKTVTVAVRGAADAADAERVARTVSRSLLVKTAWFGEDANWGRIIAAVGNAGVAVEPAAVRIFLDDVLVVDGGRRAPDYREEDGTMVFRRPAYTVAVEIGAGPGTFSVLAADLSYDYVRINADYRT